MEQAGRGHSRAGNTRGGHLCAFCSARASIPDSTHSMDARLMHFLLRPAQAISLAPLALLGLTQCGAESAGPTVPPCTVNVGLQIGPSTAPRIAWTPNCALLAVDVVDSVTGESVWSLVSASGRNTIRPGVRYATVPAGTTEDLEAVPLVSGRRYWVFLSRLDERDPALPVAQTAGEDRFTP
jgi:hypothetical protein